MSVSPLLHEFAADEDGGDVKILLGVFFRILVDVLGAGFEPGQQIRGRLDDLLVKS